MSNKGLLRRPMTLILVPTLLLATALSLPMQVMWLYSHGLSEWRDVLHKLTWLNDLVMLGCLVTAVLVYQASPGARLALPALFGLVAVNNFYVGYLATDFSPTMAGFATAGFALILSPIYLGEVRELLSQPERRWWRTKERWRLALPMFVGDADRKYNGETYDISETGAFLPIEDAGFKVNGLVHVCLTLGELRQIRCEARVVRQASARGSYPGGIGIEFTNMDGQQRRELKRHLESSSKRKDSGVF